MKKKLFLCSALALCIFGANTVVKAEQNPYVVSSVPDTFVTKNAGIEYNGTTALNDNDAGLANQSILLSASADVVDYHTTTGLKVFCIDRKTEYAPSSSYQKDSVIDDYGIVYIIANANSYYNSISTTGVIEGNQKYEMSWFTQMAIWQYQDNEFANLTVSGDIEEAYTTDVKHIYSNRAKLLWDEAKKLANAAKTATDPSTTASLKLDYDGGHTLDKENKVIKTNIISLKTSGIALYSLDLSNAPAGTKVYDEYNQEINDLTKVNVARFYLVVPVENVDDYAYEFNIPVATNSYTYYKGYKYTSGNNQPLVLVTKDVKDLDTTITVKASHIEDTASIISNSIYFVGFLILVSGVAIIYVNTRKKEQQI